MASKLDVRDAPQVDDRAAEILDRFGRRDVQVNNTGILRDRRLERMSDEEWGVLVDVDLSGVFRCTRAIFPIMKLRR